MVILNATAATDAGRVRSNNEDNFYINGKYKKSVIRTDVIVEDSKSRQKYIYAVCDGMGGAENGELASLMTVQLITSGISLTAKELWESLVARANSQICMEMQRIKRRMGTTAALLVVENDMAYCFNIGDSRIYLFRDGELIQLSKDHTMVQAMVDSGMITKEQATNHVRKHVLSQHIGIFESEMKLSPFSAEPIKLKQGDFFVLCSDGVTDMVDDGVISDIIQRSPNATSAAKQLIQKANHNGGVDNVTVVAVQIDAVERQSNKKRK